MKRTIEQIVNEEMNITTYDAEEARNQILNALEELEPLMENFNEIKTDIREWLDEDEAMEYVKHEIADDADLFRIKCLLDGVEGSGSMFRLDAYNNLETVYVEDVEAEAQRIKMQIGDLCGFDVEH